MQFLIPKYSPLSSRGGKNSKNVEKWGDKLRYLVIMCEYFDKDRIILMKYPIGEFKSKNEALKYIEASSEALPDFMFMECKELNN